jgi:hypothetical protein
MLEKGATEGIDIRVGILDLSNCAQDAGNGIKALSGKVADVIVLDVFVGEALKMEEAGVSATQDCMAISRDDLALA